MAWLERERSPSRDRAAIQPKWIVPQPVAEAGPGSDRRGKAEKFSFTAIDVAAHGAAKADRALQQGFEGGLEIWL